MFIPVRKNIMRWGTPDPEGDWIMYGFLLVNEEGCVLIDPPLVPGLLDSVRRIGPLKAVILTTLDHTRGAKYISGKAGATMFIPDQVKSKAVDPEGVLQQKEIRDFQKYSSNDMFGLRPCRITVEGKKGDTIPWMDEFALLTENRELIVGDIAIGTSSRKVMLAPEWFPHEPPHPRHEPAAMVFSELVKKTGATTLLSTHGENLYGTLQELAFERPEKLL